MNKKYRSTMPKEIKQKWLDGLRSGEYAQCTESLSDGNGFCCLGVLEMVVDGDVERNKGGFRGVPSRAWLDKHNIEFKNFHGHATDNPSFIISDIKTLNEMHEFITMSNDYIASCSAATLNDKLNFDFKQIADLIESQIKGV